MSPEELDLLVREQAPFVFDRMFNAVEKVRQRLDRVCNALGAANVPYAVVGGNAVAAWVATLDEGAVRNTRDVDILLDRRDFAAASVALSGVGFVPAETMNVTMFLDGENGRPSEAIHVIWAGEKVRKSEQFTTPEVGSVVDINGKRIVELMGLLRMKLTAFRRKDQVHVLDMIGVGLLDQRWVEKLGDTELATRLQTLLDDPDG